MTVATVDKFGRWKIQMMGETRRGRSAPRQQADLAWQASS
jgi:hypothetical protein